MRWNVDERCVELARYIVNNSATVRATAKKYGLSKSTVHKDVTDRLKQCDLILYKEVKCVLDENKNQRHLRGGMATKRKYEALQEQRKNNEKPEV